MLDIGENASTEKQMKINLASYRFDVVPEKGGFGLIKQVYNYIKYVLCEKPR